MKKISMPRFDVTGLARRFAGFAAMGMVNVSVNYAVFATLILLNTAVPVALACGTIVSVAFAYVVGGRLIFGNSGLARLPHFLFAYLVSFSVNLLLLYLLNGQGVAPLISQLVAIPPIVVLNFALLQLFVFRAGRTPPSLARR